MPLSASDLSSRNRSFENTNIRDHNGAGGTEYGGTEYGGTEYGTDYDTISIATTSNRTTGRSKRAREKKKQEKQQQLKEYREKLRDGVTVVWLRDDMRFHDNHALSCGDFNLRPWDASKIICVYIDETDTENSKRVGNNYPLRGAGLWYKGESLKHFQKELKLQYGVDLLLRRGDPAEVLLDVVGEYEAWRVVWNERYEPWAVYEDKRVRKRLERGGRSSRGGNRGANFGGAGERGWQAENGRGWGDNHVVEDNLHAVEEEDMSLVGLDLTPAERTMIFASTTSGADGNKVHPRPFEETRSTEPATATNIDKDNDLPPDRDPLDPRLSHLPLLYDTTELTIQVFNGTLLAPPWIANPEVNVPHGHGFGSVQWYKRAIANIPKHHMRLDNPLYQRTIDYSSRNALKRVELERLRNKEGWMQLSFEELYDCHAESVEDYLSPLPRIQGLMVAKPKEHRINQTSQNALTSGNGNRSRNLTHSELGYLKTSGKLMPTKNGGELYRAELERKGNSNTNGKNANNGNANDNHKSKDQNLSPPSEQQKSLGIFKQYNPLREKENAKTTSKSSIHDWANEMKKYWKVGEEAAHFRLEKFCNEVLSEGLFEGRERFRADREYTAILSPYIRFGELTGRSCFARGAQVVGFINLPEKGNRELRATFLRRMLWRDLAYWCYWRFPDLPDVSLRKQYEHQEWWREEEEKGGKDYSSLKTSMKTSKKGEDKVESDEIESLEVVEKGSSGSGEDNKHATVINKTSEPKKRNRFKKKSDNDISKPVFQPFGRGAGQLGQVPGGAPGGTNGNGLTGIMNTKSSGSKVSALGLVPTPVNISISSPDKSSSSPGLSPDISTGITPQHPQSDEKLSVLAHTNKNSSSSRNKPSRNKPLTRLRAWQRGETGFPLVDAAMRQLWLI